MNQYMGLRLTPCESKLRWIPRIVFFRQLTLQKKKTETKQNVGSARTNKLTAHISHLLVGKHELLFPQDMAPYSLEDATHSQQNERQVSVNVLFLVS